MTAADAIPAATAVLVVLLGYVAQLVQERGRRRHDALVSALHEQKTTYAAFLTAIVRWQHAIVDEHQTHFSSSSDESRNLEARQNLSLARQEAMTPLFALRMVGSPTVLTWAEAIVNFNYDYQDAHTRPDPGLPKPVPEWLRLRDGFIAEVRNETDWGRLT